MDLYVERKGKGKSILVLHGILSDHRQLEPIYNKLDGYELFLVDLYGCGKSDKTPSADIVQRNVKTLKALCKKHKIDTVIAYSISGIIAIELNLPNTVFVSCFCTAPNTEAPLLRLTLKQGVRQWIMQHENDMQRFLTNYLKRDILVPGLKQASMPCATYYLLAGERDYTKKAKKLRRVLVLHGTKDALIKHKLGVELAKVTSAAFVSVPETHLTIINNKTVHAAIKSFVH